MQRSMLRLSALMLLFRRHPLLRTVARAQHRRLGPLQRSLVAVALELGTGGASSAAQITKVRFMPQI